MGKYFKCPSVPVLDYRWYTLGFKGLADPSRRCHWICGRILPAVFGLAVRTAIFGSGLEILLFPWLYPGSVDIQSALPDIAK